MYKDEARQHNALLEEYLGIRRCVSKARYRHCSNVARTARGVVCDVRGGKPHASTLTHHCVRR